MAKSLVGSYSADDIANITATKSKKTASNNPAQGKTGKKKLVGVYEPADIENISKGQVLASTVDTGTPFDAMMSFAESKKGGLWTATAKGLQTEFGGNLTPANPYGVKNDPVYQARTAAQKSVADAQREIDEATAEIEKLKASQPAKEPYKLSMDLPAVGREYAIQQAQRMQEYQGSAEQKIRELEKKRQYAESKLRSANEASTYVDIYKNGDESLFAQYRAAMIGESGNIVQGVGAGVAQNPFGGSTERTATLQEKQKLYIA